MNRFEDETPITVTVATTKGALTALMDNPALLLPADTGPFVAAVHRGVADLRKAVEA